MSSGKLSDSHGWAITKNSDLLQATVSLMHVDNGSLLPSLVFFCNAIDKEY